MPNIQNSRNILWIKIKLFSIAASVLKVKYLNVLWLDGGLLPVLNVLFDGDVIISLLFFKHGVIYNCTAVSLKFYYVTFIYSFVLTNENGVILLLDAMLFLNSSYCDLITTQTIHVGVVTFWTKIKSSWKVAELMVDLVVSIGYLRSVLEHYSGLHLVANCVLFVCALLLLFFVLLLLLDMRNR